MNTPEPNPKMDGLLKDYARQRREQAGSGFPLHPATRKMLLDEAARQHGRTSAPAGARPASVWSHFWMRLAWVGSGVAVLVVFLAVLITGQQKEQMAFTKEGKAAREVPLETTTLGTDTPVLAADLRKESALVAGAASRLKADQPRNEHFYADQDKWADQSKVVLGDDALPTASSSSSFSLDLTNRIAQDERAGRTDGFLAAAPEVKAPEAAWKFQDQLEGARKLANAPAAAPAPSAPGLPATPAAKPAGGAAAALASSVSSNAAFLGRLTQASAPSQNRQNFQQLRAFSQSGPAGQTQAGRPGLLENFQVEQSGRKLRFYDADGSMYEGEFLAAVSTEAETTMGSETLAQAKAETPAKPRAAKAKDARSNELAKAARPVPRLPGRTAAMPAAMPAAMELDDLEPPLVFFRVSGTNRQNNQLVVINGQLFTDTNLAQTLPAERFTGLGNAIPRDLEETPAPQQTPTELRQRVEGRVWMAPTHEFELRAFEVQP